MEPAMWWLLIAGVGLLLSLVCMVVFVKSKGGEGETEPESLRTPDAPQGSIAEGPETVTQENEAAESLGVEPDSFLDRYTVQPGQDLKQCFFVILDWPGLDTNRRLARIFRKYQAHYDTKLGVYTIRDPLAGYKLTVANASPPGTLPPIHEGDDHPIVAGVSILFHFLHKRNVARHPEMLIELTQAVVAIGGHILDAERKVVTTKDFEELRNQARTRPAKD